jgi:hypothetical protein
LCLVQQDNQVLLVVKDPLDHLDPLDLKEDKEFLVDKGPKVKLEPQEEKVQLVHREVLYYS